MDNSVYLFAGDSLVEGVYGESYVKGVFQALAANNPQSEPRVINAGRSGDTVSALEGRIDHLLQEYQTDWVILAVGTNDVWWPWLAGHSLGWRIGLAVRHMRTGQRATSDLDQFAAAYRSLIDRCRRAGARVLACTVGPIGEQISSPLNQQVARLNGVIKHVVAEQQVPLADVWQAAVEELSGLPRGSGYFSGEWLFAWMDRRRYATAGPEAMAKRRGLHLTFDGVHLTAQGADLWSRTIVAALERAEWAEPGTSPVMPAHVELSHVSQQPLQVSCSPGWELRARSLAAWLAQAYESLASLTGARPAVRLAVLSELHWRKSACPGAYPTPCVLWDGEQGTVFVPSAYDDEFQREMRLPEVVSSAATWPTVLAQLGEPAKVMALADLLAVEELARVFLQHLRVAPADPALVRLLAAYLAQIVLHEPGSEAGALLRHWDEWSAGLARAGNPEGHTRVQAGRLYREHGRDLVPSFTGGRSATEVAALARQA
ncbi:MAG TPA: GDSL-type esterase/lipase family protein [Anaerolineae bacterium]|nr:GDSL-type esterase/lipase family protein [Anaerolineae bacterium]